MYTLMWDMHSGGGQKEKWSKIYIEAPIDEAKVIFYNRFGHNPERVTCTCCGKDYAIDEYPTLEEASAYHRNCASIRKGKEWRYLEGNGRVGEPVPEGWTIDYTPYGDYKTVSQYLLENIEQVLVIRAEDIKPEERKGDVPEEGYVWV